MNSMTTPVLIESGRDGHELPRSGSRPAFRPRVDIRESDREIVLLADLPGAQADAIDVRCENGTLTVIARVKPRGNVGQRYLLQEYGVGDYSRSFELDERIDAGRISGEFADGVLTLRLPKREAARPTRVAIRAG